MTEETAGFTHIGGTLGDVLKEVIRRAELRSRVEAEVGKPLSDQEFIALVEKSGLKI